MRQSSRNSVDRTSLIRLSEAIRRGDEVAFAEYYEGVQGALIAFIERFTGNEDEAVNIAHDAFIKLWERREQVGQLNGFVYTTATNGALDLLRKRQVHARYVDEQMFVQNGEIPASDESLMFKELTSQIEQAVEGMPPQRRRVFEMSRDENLTYNEIAERLNISYDTVKGHIEAALQNLRATLTSLALLVLLS